MSKKETPKKPKISVTLKSLGRTYKATGDTLQECLDQIKISGGAKTLSVLTVKTGDQTVEKILSGSISQRLFGAGSPTTKMIFQKKVGLLVGL